MRKDKYLLKVRRSRKTYFLIYLMIFIVAFSCIYLYYLGYEIGSSVQIISIVFIVIFIKITEIHRLRDWWGVTNSSLVQSKGILNKNVREVDFSSISDLDLNQPFFKRLLNYGDVNVRLFLNETSICIEGISRPNKFIENLNDIISSKKGVNHGIKKT